MQSQGGSGSWAREGQVPGNRAIIQITVNRRNLLLKKWSQAGPFLGLLGL